METNRTFDKGWWILVIILVILGLVRFNSTFHAYVSDALHLPHDKTSGDAPPFWSMRQQLVEGLCAGIAVLLILVLVALTWKRYRKYSSMALWLAWLWCMPAVIDALIIYWRSLHLMDARRAESVWKTFGEFHQDPLRQLGLWGTLLASLPFAYVLRKWYGWKQSDETSGATSFGSAS